MEGGVEDEGGEDTTTLDKVRGLWVFLYFHIIYLVTTQTRAKMIKTTSQLFL